MRGATIRQAANAGTLAPPTTTYTTTTLHGAIGANSRQVSALFRRVEIELAGLFEAETLTEVAAGTSPVTFFSDLPLEWTAVDDCIGTFWQQRSKRG